MRRLISCLYEEFSGLHARSLALLEVIPPEKLYWQPRASSGPFPIYSCGEHILRSAGAVEQTCGGINSNLWDDPFEWTLPESLKTNALVRGYLMEVEATRQNSFERFTDDRDLAREIAVPSGGTKPLGALLIETLSRASHYQGRAVAVFRLFSDARLPRV